MIQQTRAFVGKALAWTVDHLDGFDPFSNGREYEVKSGQKVGELAILLHAYTALTGKRRTPEIWKIVRLLESVRERRDFSDRLMRSPQEFILFAEVYSNLRSAGHDSSAQRKNIQAAIDAGYLGFTERLPHRVMDVASCLERGRFRHPLPSLPELFSKSILTPVPCPILLDEDALYFLTHVILFVYDFGARRTLRLPKRTLRALQQALSALIVSMCHEHHWDLLAELLACWDCLGFEHGPVYERAWKELIAVQKDDGAVPGPEWALKLHEELDSEPESTAEPEFYFSHHYHTTLVSIIAGCLRLERRRARRLEKASAADRKAAWVQVPGGSGSGRLSLLRREFSHRALPGVLQNGARWLEDLLEPGEGTGARSAALGPSTLCSILTAAWTCASIGGKSGRWFAELSQTVGNRLARATETSDDAWSGVPPTLNLVAGSLLRSQGVEVPFLHDRDGYVQRVAAALTQHAPASALDDLGLSEKRALLNAVGLQPQPPAVDFRTLARFVAQFRYSDDRQAVERLLLMVRSHTRHGTRGVPDRKGVRQIGETLSRLALAYLRNYDLITACGLLRAARYLGFEDSVALTCLDFLCFSQRSDGSFGWLGAEERKLLGRKGLGPDAQVDLYLPIAVECLWTLAEARGTWRLAGSLPRWRSRAASGRQRV